jgi:Big-like domain-containing protein
MKHGMWMFSAVLGAALAGLVPGDRVEAGTSAAGFVVVAVSPASGQSVLPDLSDPGVNSRITVRFSDRLDPLSVADDGSSPVELRDQTLASIPVNATVRRNVLSIDPFSAPRPLLAQGKYTLTLRSTIRSARGRLLNRGDADTTTTFNVGADVYAPVLLATVPARAQDGVSLHRPIVLTFDEAIDAASAAAAVRLEDRSTIPATPIPSRVRLARRGAQVVVLPDPRAGLPADTDITVVVQGRGTEVAPEAPVLRDAAGNAFARDAGTQWTADPLVPTLQHSDRGDYDDASGEFTVSFRTRAARR